VTKSPVARELLPVSLDSRSRTEAIAPHRRGWQIGSDP